MKNLVKTLLSLIFCFQIASCDIYKSKVPITDSKSSSINKNWIDKWVGLTSDEKRGYPLIEINLQAFNDKEYVATVKYFEEKGRKINMVETYKVHNSKIMDSEFLNIKSLDSNRNDYLFYKIQEDLTDSIIIRYLTDSLKIEFDKQDDLKDFLIKEQPKIENEVLSEQITFYKWTSLTWDKVNKENKSGEFEAFYFVGNYDEEQFLKLSNEELEELIKKKRKTKQK